MHVFSLDKEQEWNPKRHMEKILKKLALRNRVEAAICGLMLNGCPHESSSGCAFRKLLAGGDGAAPSWAD